jgi:hypothetical protein
MLTTRTPILALVAVTGLTALASCTVRDASDPGNLVAPTVDDARRFRLST